MVACHSIGVCLDHLWSEPWSFVPLESPLQSSISNWWSQEEFKEQKVHLW
jgi:hypothetical protein